MIMANQQPEQPEQQTYWRQWLKNRILRMPGMQRVSRWFQRFQGIPLRFARYRGQKLLDIEPVREELGHKQGRTDTGEERKENSKHKNINKKKRHKINQKRKKKKKKEK